MEALAFGARPDSLKNQVIDLMRIGILWVQDKILLEIPDGCSCARCSIEAERFVAEARGRYAIGISFVDYW
jgi:hypothetical protein